MTKFVSTMTPEEEAQWVARGGATTAEPVTRTNAVLAARLAAGMTQTALANAAGVFPETICNIEKQRHNPTVRVALGIARALGTTVEDLFGGAK